MARWAMRNIIIALFLIATPALADVTGPATRTFSSADEDAGPFTPIGEF